MTRARNHSRAVGEAESERQPAESAVRTRVSGLYRAAPEPGSQPWPSPRPTSALLRLDIDGDSPQMVASGELRLGIRGRITFAARVRRNADGSYRGTIFYRDALQASFPYRRVRIELAGGPPPAATAKVSFSDGTAWTPPLRFRYQSPHFRTVEFEYDRADGATPVLSVDPTAHPNHASGVPSGPMSLGDAYRRAGIDARVSPGSGGVSIALAGSDQLWSDQEMHDAMQSYWSRFANRPQWAVWVFFARLHETGSDLGGIMFDDIGPNHRQGTAIFTDSFISQAPAGDPAPAAWVERMRFWTAVHEIGHTFNLAHSWDKEKGTPWMTLSDEPEARSFMNYPYNVAGGTDAFFADFAYRFSDQELLFMRHAPERFVQQGNADWFDHHGFEQARPGPEGLTLLVRANRPRPFFDFLEPVVLELKLKNESDEPKLVPDDLLSRPEATTFVVRKRGGPARQLSLVAQPCRKPRVQALGPGQAIYDSLFAGAGQGGWLVAEPGDYEVQVAVHLPAHDVVSNRFRFRVSLPGAREEEHIAQDFFEEDVGRVLALDGTRWLKRAEKVLQDVAEKLPESRAAIHAAAALAVPASRAYKLLRFGPPDERAVTQAEMARIDVLPPDAQEMQSRLAALERGPTAESLGHVDFKFYMDRVTSAFETMGDLDAAADAQKTLLDSLKPRGVREPVLTAIQERRDVLSTRSTPQGKRKPSKK